jgi:hypothetical protein
MPDVLGDAHTQLDTAVLHSAVEPSTLFLTAMMLATIVLSAPGTFNPEYIACSGLARQIWYRLKNAWNAKTSGFSKLECDIHLFE